MKYKLTKGTLEEYEEGRVLAVITAKTNTGEYPTEEEVVKELHANPGVVKEVIKGLTLKGKIEEVTTTPAAL
jgi:hypothetical protein